MRAHRCVSTAALEQGGSWKPTQAGGLPRLTSLCRRLSPAPRPLRVCDVDFVADYHHRLIDGVSTTLHFLPGCHLLGQGLKIVPGSLSPAPAPPAAMTVATEAQHNRWSAPAVSVVAVAIAAIAAIAVAAAPSGSPMAMTPSTPVHSVDEGGTSLLNTLADGTGRHSLARRGTG